VTGTTTARAAWDDPGTRTQRMGDVRAAWRSVDTLPLADALARGEQAAREAPLDPWAHAALGRARTRGAAVRDPRLALARADSLVRLADAGFMADALRARAADLCARAVALDPWRASDAFQVVRAAGMEGLRRVGEAAPAAGGRARARVLTAQGRAFEALGAELPDARRAAADAYAAARRADARYAPGDFAAGELLRRTGDAAGSAAALREAVNGDELGAAMEGWARLHLGEPVRAAARFEAALRHDPGHRWALEGLVEAELAAGDTTDAIRALRRLVAVVPDDVRLRTRLEGLQNPRAGRAAAPVP
jgi:tetratricopeptide (TPR) repeat protein